MSIKLHQTHIQFSNKVSTSTTIVNDKKYEKYMAYFPKVLYEYLGKPDHIYLKQENNSMLLSNENQKGYVEKRLYEVGTNGKTLYFALPKSWVGRTSPSTITYTFCFDSLQIRAIVV